VQEQVEVVVVVLRKTGGFEEVVVEEGRRFGNEVIDPYLCPPLRNLSNSLVLLNSFNVGCKSQ
jgi:hypothetical protein